MIKPRLTPGEATAALWVAIAHHDLAAAQTAIDAGADVDARNAIDVTPLHSAAAFGSPNLVDLLLESGADVNALDYAGQTPLDVAKSARSKVSELLEEEVKRRQGHTGRVTGERKDKGRPQVGG